MQKNKTVLGALLAAALFLAGCTGTSTLYSNVLVKPAEPVTGIKVLYLENKLVSSRSASSSSTGTLAAIGYNDLPELFRERVPMVFRLNNIPTDYATVEKVNFGQKEALNSAQWTKSGDTFSSLLVLQVVNGSITTSTQYGNSTVYLNLHANLFDTKTNTRQWTGQFQNTLSKTILGRISFDNDFVDKLLKTVLEQMANDGIIRLPENRAIIPVPKPEKSST